MFYNQRIQTLTSALKAAQDLSSIVSINLANTYTAGYKALEGKIVNDLPTGNNCECFESILKSYDNTGIHVEVQQSDNKNVKTTQMNGKSYENSNVDPTQELKTLVASANMTRSALAGIQIENKIQQEIMNLGR